MGSKLSILDLDNREVRKVLFLLILICVLYAPALRGMFTTWMENSNTSHGIIVPLIVFYLIRDRIQRKRETFENLLYSAEKRRGVFFGLFGLIGSLALYGVASLTDIVVFKNISFVTCIQSTTLFVFGWGVTLQLLFPLLFLFFMVPVPTSLYSMVALPMQLFATKVSIFFLHFTSLPITADGNIIRVGNEMLEVAEACSGLRSLMSFIMLSLLFAYLAQMRLWKKCVMVISSVPIAVCGNIVRIILTTFIAYIYGTRRATGFIHDASGYVMFIAAFAVFFWLSKEFEEQ